jgi:DNA-binding MurR/RpiR family transcriptional regulator
MATCNYLFELSAAKRDVYMILPKNNTLAARIAANSMSFTPLDKLLAEYLIHKTREAVFLSARELAQKNGVSLATVVRFVRHLGYSNYREFLRDIREQMDIRLSLPDRAAMLENGSSLEHRIEREIAGEIENLRNLKTLLDMSLLHSIAERIWHAPQVAIIGARMSLSISCYFSWALSRIKPQIIHLDGGNKNSLDWLTLSSKETLVIVFTVMRYPNDLLRISRVVRNQGKELIVVADSRRCPMFEFSRYHLSVPCQNFPLVGNPSAIACVANCLIYCMIYNHREEVKKHHSILETFYRENDIFFNPNDKSRLIDGL